MPQMFIFGLGYSARFLASALAAEGWTIAATGSAGTVAFDDTDAVRHALRASTHVLSSVPPAAGGDPVLDLYGNALAGRWLGYLSSTGVYGDAGGAWVDEASPVRPTARPARGEADAAWLALGARVFRLPGIYGPGRSAIDRVRGGTAHRIAIEYQVFSRIHVEDIVGGIVGSLATGAPPGAYNLADDLPSSQNAVIEEACRLLGTVPPPLQSMDEAGLGPMARSFYADNRRVANGRAKRMLGWRLRYPTYRDGLAAIMARARPAGAEAPSVP